MIYHEPPLPCFTINGTELIKYNGEGGSVTVPRGITVIGESAFEGSEITHIDLPDTLEAILTAAFRDCKSLTSVEFPASLTVVAEEAFFGCSALSGSVVFGNGLSCIGKRAFAHLSEITELILPESVGVIGDEAFSGCKKLRNAVLPRVCASLGKGAFEGCEGLTHIDAPLVTTLLDTKVFYGCSGLQTLSVPSKPDERGYGYSSDSFGSAYKVLVRCEGGDAHCDFGRDNKILELEIEDGIETVTLKVTSAFPRLLTAVLPPSLCSLPGGFFISAAKLRTVVFNGRRTEFGKSVFPKKSCPVIYAPNAPISDLSEEYRPAFVAGYFAMLGEGVPLCDRVKDSYDTYLSENSVILLEKFLKTQEYHPFFDGLAEYITGKGLLTRDAVDEILEKGLFVDDIELTSRLLSYKNERFGEDGDSFLL